MLVRGGLPDQTGRQVAEVGVEAGVRTVVGQHLERAVEEDVVAQVSVALGVQQRGVRQPAPVDHHLVALGVLDAERPADLHRVESVDRAGDLGESHVLVQPVPADREPRPGVGIGVHGAGVVIVQDVWGGITAAAILEDEQPAERADRVDREAAIIEGELVRTAVVLVHEGFGGRDARADHRARDDHESCDKTSETAHD